MAALDQTSFDAALKDYFTDERIFNLVYDTNPFAAMVPKNEKFFGRNIPIPIIYGNPGGRSRTESTAITNQTPGLYEAFDLTRKGDFQAVKISLETMLSSENDKGAFFEAVTTEIEGKLKNLGRNLAISQYGSSGGSIGRLASTSVIASTTGTLSDPSQIANIEKGMRLCFSANKDGTSLRDSGDVVVVTGVNRSAGVFYTSAANQSTTISGLAVLDYIFVEGDATKSISGLDDWCPMTDDEVSATSFYGVDRSVDKTRLGGCRYDGSGQNIDEALIDALSLGAREGGIATHCFMNFTQWSNLAKILGAKANYTEFKKAEVSFRGIVLNGPRGNAVQVYADQNCPGDRAYLLQMDTWKFYSLGKAPRLLREDGVSMLRGATDSSMEARAFYFGNLGCRAPGYNTVVKLSV